jgi:hypothetical protein
VADAVIKDNRARGKDRRDEREQNQLFGANVISHFELLLLV